MCGVQVFLVYVYVKNTSLWIRSSQENLSFNVLPLKKYSTITRFYDHHVHNLFHLMLFLYLFFTITIILKAENLLTTGISTYLDWFLGISFICRRNLVIHVTSEASVHLLWGFCHHAGGEYNFLTSHLILSVRKKIIGDGRSGHNGISRDDGNQLWFAI